MVIVCINAFALSLSAATDAKVAFGTFESILAKQQFPGSNPTTVVKCLLFLLFSSCPTM